MKKIEEFAACAHTPFSAFKKYLKAEFLTFLEIAIYCTRPCAI